MRFVWLGIVAVLSAVAPAAQAESWLVGDPLRSTPSNAADNDFTLGFTPRAAGLSLDGVRFNLSVGPGTSPASDVSGLSFDEGAASDGFVLGGALALDDVELSAEFTQREQRVGTSASWRATLSAGNVTTSLGYTEDARTVTGNRFSLGAAVEAVPGVNVGAGVALDDLEGAGHDGDTTGMVRFQLQF